MSTTIVASLTAARADIRRAIADFDKAIQLLPDYTLALVNRGAAAYSIGEVDKAIADYERAIDIRSR